MRFSLFRLEGESLVYFDAAHLQKLVRDGRWEAAGRYMRRFSQLWESEVAGQHFTAFRHTLENNAMLHYLACRGDDGGRAASSLFCCDDDAFRSKFPEIAQRHDLYRSMASKQARYTIKSMSCTASVCFAYSAFPQQGLVLMQTICQARMSMNYI
jgi:hypothetical protein